MNESMVSIFAKLKKIKFIKAVTLNLIIFVQLKNNPL